MQLVRGARVSSDQKHRDYAADAVWRDLLSFSSEIKRRSPYFRACAERTFGERGARDMSLTFGRTPGYGTILSHERIRGEWPASTQPNDPPSRPMKGRPLKVADTRDCYL